MRQGPLSNLVFGRQTEIPRQDGRTFLVTGATSGVGRFCAEQLSRAGAHVILAVRDVDAGRRVAAALPGPAEVRRLDLADLAAVRAFADRLDTDVDVVIGNAGVMHLAGGATADGFELNMGVNHLGHFALVGLILPRLRDRYVALSSHTHRRASIDVARMAEPVPPGTKAGMRAYGASKLACQLFALELNRRLARAGSTVTALAGDPGYTASGLFADEKDPFRRATLSLGAALFASPIGIGSGPILQAATADLPGGTLVGGRRSGARATPVGPAVNDDLARRVWERSVQLTGVDFDGL